MEKDIKAYQQGNLDGLCGVYALVNAYKLVNKQSGEPQKAWKRLFHAALAEIGEERVLDVLQSGMHINILLSINKRVFQKKCPHIRLKRPFLRIHPTTQLIMLKITEILSTKRGVVLLSYSCRRYGHWTVIHDETLHNYLLADSSNIKYLRKKSFEGKAPSHHFEEVLLIVFHSSS